MIYSFAEHAFKRNIRLLEATKKDLAEQVEVLRWHRLDQIADDLENQLELLGKLIEQAATIEISSPAQAWPAPASYSSPGQQAGGSDLADHAAEPAV